MYITSQFKLIFLAFIVYIHLSPCFTSKGYSVEAKTDVLRILGGVNTTITKHRYTVQILNHAALCGGVILKSYIILTVAHCFDFNEDPNFIDIVAGATKLRGGKSYPVLKIMIHVEYGATSRYDNDIALVFLRNHVIFERDNVEKVLIAGSENWRLTRTKLIIVGWGMQGELTPISNVLKQAYVYYVPLSKCQRLFASYVNLTQGMFCGFRPSADTCAGDSGGPVTWNGYLVGLVSFGFRCGRSSYPGVYVNVQYYISWIKEMISKFNKGFCEVNGNIIPKVRK